MDESSLTGESFPHEARTGQKVKGGAIVQAGYMEIEVTAKLQDSLVYQVYEMVECETPTLPIAWRGCSR